MDGVDASIKLNSPTADSIDLTKVQKVSSPFKRFYLTHTAQTDKTLILAIGGDASFEVTPEPQRQTPYYTTTVQKTSTNAYVSMSALWIANVKNIVLTLRETGGVNAVLYKIETSMDCTNWKEKKAETTLNASGHVEHGLTDTWRWIQVQIKSAVAGNHGDVYLTLNAEKM